MQAELMWFIGIAVTVILTLGGAIIAAFQRLSGRITDGDDANRREIDRVKENYVRRDDLADEMRRVDESIKEVKENIRENHRQTMAAIEKSN